MTYQQTGAERSIEQIDPRVNLREVLILSHLAARNQHESMGTSYTYGGSWSLNCVMLIDDVLKHTLQLE